MGKRQLVHVAGLALLVLGCGAEESPPAPAPDVALPGVELVDVHLSHALVRPGDALLAGLTFEVREGARIPGDLEVFLHLEDPEERCEGIRVQEDHAPDPPTAWWRAGARTELAARLVELPEELAEGDYLFHVGLYDPRTHLRHAEAEPRVVRVRGDAPSWAELRVPGAREPTRELRADAEVSGEGWRFAVQREPACWELVDERAAVRWTSHPLEPRLASVRFERGEEELVLPFDRVDELEALEGAARLTARFTLPETAAPLAVTLQARAVRDGESLELGWSAVGGGAWSVRSVTLLDRGAWTSDAVSGAVVLPQWLGELAPARGALPRCRELRANDLSMQMGGLLRGGAALLLTWSDHEARLTSRAEYLARWGLTVRSLSLEVDASSPTLELEPLGPGDYTDLARAYRAVAERRGFRQRGPRARDTAGAPVLRLEGFLHTEERPLRHSFDEMLACARHWREDLELDRARVLIAGWNRAGYDSGHPDVWPANEACGGNAGLARCVEGIQALGYQVGLHDNYQDIYQDSPSWDPELVARDEDGQPRAGGVWGGGQSWMVCSRLQAAFAQRNLARLAEVAAPDFVFLDTTLTTRLQVCTHPEHPMSVEDDRAARLELFALAREAFGGLGLEGAREWAVPAADLMEGVLTHRTVHGETFTAIPLFPIVYGDQVDLLTVQADRVGVGDTRSLCDHLVYGELPVVELGPGLYWRAESALVEGDLRDSAFAFARADRGWARDLAPTDRLLKNSYEVLSFTHRAIGGAAMEDHRFVGEAREVEESVHGDVRITVNYGDKPYATRGVILGRFGFLVEAPGFTAFHVLERGGVAYPGGACFTVRSLDGANLADSNRVRVYHAFGARRLALWDAEFEVDREEILER